MATQTGLGVGRESLWVAGGTAASRITGFARVFALGFAVGQSPLADLYTQANAAPNLVFELVVGGVLSATLVPLFVDARDKGDDEASSVLLSTGFVASAVLAIIALSGAFGIDVFLRHSIGQGSGDTTGSLLHLRIFIDLVYLVLPQILFYGIASLCTAYLNAARRYRTAAFSPVLTNLVTIAAFIWIGRDLQGKDALLDTSQRDLKTLLWLGLGTTAGIVAMTIPMMWDIRRHSSNLRFTPRLRHWTISRMARLSGWTVGYVIANQVALLTIIVLLDDNKRYSDAFIFFQLPHGLIAVSLMTTLTPELASAAAARDYQALADRFVKGLRLLAVLVIPAAVGYVFLATPITSFLQRGNLTPEDARLTGRAVASFALGLPAFSAYLFACRGFYSISDTRTPFVLNVIENGLNIVGVGGLVVIGLSSSTPFALAYSAAYTAAALLALIRFDQAIMRRDSSVVRPDISPLFRMLTAALAMGLVLWIVRQVLPADSGSGAVAAILVGMIAGGATYLGIGLQLGIEELHSAWGAFRRRLPL